MKAKKLFYMECHLAGRMYHDADEVFDRLKVGTKLSLVYDADNRYDENAVAVIYTSTDDVDNGEEYLLGYLPRCHNADIAKFLQMGWNNIFECRISKIDPEVHYERQINLTIRILPNNCQ